jgi:hypothetical protein
MLGTVISTTLVHITKRMVYSHDHQITFPLKTLHLNFVIFTTGFPQSI